MTRSDWWTPEVHARRRPYLAARGRITQAIRQWFEAEGFTETACGALQLSPGNEAHLHAFATDFVGDNGTRQRLYLHTSPEFAMKKLLAAGETRIFEFARVYRNRETGPRHAPEFTLLEWYRAGEGLEAIAQDTVAVIVEASRAVGASLFRWQGHACDPLAPPIWLSVTEAFVRFAGIALDRLLDDRAGLIAACRDRGVGIAGDASWTDAFSAVLVTLIEPRLGEPSLTVLHSYPLSEAALAARDAKDPRYAQRFEVYACGLELANGYHELTDPDELRVRQMREMDLKQAMYGERYPLDDDFLAAVAAMPPASGVALGFDRLVMLASGATHIHDVLWTPPPARLGEH